MNNNYKVQRYYKLQKRLPHNKDSFVHKFNFYKIVWIIIIGGLLGYIVETTWNLAVTGEFLNNQGLIYMPIKPVYALGAILFSLLAEKIININGLFIFLICAFIGAFFEFLCSLFQEYVLGKAFWDYSDSPFNIQGRTSLFYAILWGTLGLIFIRHIYPFACRMIEKIPNKPGKIITWLLFVFLIFNIFISTCAIKRQTNRNHGIPPKNIFSEFLDKCYDDEFLSKVYCTMTTL